MYCHICTLPVHLPSKQYGVFTSVHSLVVPHLHAPTPPVSAQLSAESLRHEFSLELFVVPHLQTLFKQVSVSYGHPDVAPLLSVVHSAEQNGKLVGIELNIFSTIIWIYV